MNILQEARRWRNAGLTPIPCRWGSKTPIIKWGEWIGRELPDDEQLEQWFMWSGRVNLALLINPDWVVLDFDLIGSYMQWSDRYPQAAQTYTVKTARGVHVYLRVDEYVVVTGSMQEYVGEVKATGIVMKRGMHPSGRLYRVIDDSPPLRVPTLGRAGIHVKTIDMQQHIATRPACPDTSSMSFVIDRIKAMMPIDVYLARFARGPWYASRDGTFMTTCPFHDDHNPSLWVIPQEGRAYCFSPRCSAHRRCDVVQVAALAYQCSMGEAVKRLCDDLGLEYIT